MTTPYLFLDEYQTKFNTKCIATFSKQRYQWQSDIGGSMLCWIHTKVTTIHQLCIQPTGGGKSLLFTTVAACLGQITVCITPLLSLGADQTIKHQHNTKAKSKELSSIHLDKVPQGDMELILNRLFSAAPLSSILVHASPQSLVTDDTGQSAFLNFILQNCNLLAMIVIDKIHLLTEFGRSFRTEFSMLKSKLFEKVKANTPMLFLTATY